MTDKHQLDVLAEEFGKAIAQSYIKERIKGFFRAVKEVFKYIRFRVRAFILGYDY